MKAGDGNVTSSGNEIEAVTLMAFLTSLADALTSAGLIMTIDIGGCPSFHDFICSGVTSIAGLLHVNTMDSFGATTVQAFQRNQRSDQAPLAERWAPGFEPGNIGETNFRAVTTYMASANVTAMSTWQVHEANVGDQPQWLFDAVNGFIDSP